MSNELDRIATLLEECSPGVATEEATWLQSADGPAIAFRPSSVLFISVDEHNVATVTFKGGQQIRFREPAQQVVTEVFTGPFDRWDETLLACVKGTEIDLATGEPVRTT